MASWFGAARNRYKSSDTRFKEDPVQLGPIQSGCDAV